MGIMRLASMWMLAECAWLTAAGPISDGSSVAVFREKLALAASQPAGLMPARGPADEPTRQYASSQPSLAKTQPTDKATSGPYTRPSKPAIGFLSGKSAGSGASGMGSGGVARQASEAKVSASSLSTSGAAGLAAPQPGVGKGPVLTIPGIQRGYAVGLGFANRQNVLTWQRNPADRPCQDLIRAGFLPGAGVCGRRR